MLRASSVVAVLTACGSTSSALSSPTPAKPLPAEPATATSAPAVDAAVSVDASVATKLRAGDTIVIIEPNGMYYAREKLKQNACRPWTETSGAFPKDWGRREPWQFEVGTVIDTARCPEEVVLADFHGVRAAIFADAVQPAPPRCPAAVFAMHGQLFPAWQACFGKIPERNRLGGGLGAVKVRFDAAGVVEDVSWDGTTGWGPTAAVCMKDATQRANLDGRDCAGITVRIAKDFATFP